MKIRKGFVTNSSSSSFIITFKDEEDFEEFRDYCKFLDYDEFYELIKNYMKPYGIIPESEYDEHNEYDEDDEDFDPLLVDDSPEAVDEDTFKREQKERALDLLYNYYKWDIADDILSKENPHLDYMERHEILNSEEFKEQVNKIIYEKTDYLEKKKKIEEAEFIVNGMIWDTSGGIMEWSIRNGFIEDNFWRNCLLRFNVG